MQTGDGQEGPYSEGTFPFYSLLVSDCTLALHKGRLVEEPMRALHYFSQLYMSLQGPEKDYSPGTWLSG